MAKGCPRGDWLCLVIYEFNYNFEHLRCACVRLQYDNAGDLPSRDCIWTLCGQLLVNWRWRCLPHSLSPAPAPTPTPTPFPTATQSATAAPTPSSTRTGTRLAAATILYVSIRLLSCQPEIDLWPRHQPPPYLLWHPLCCYFPGRMSHEGVVRSCCQMIINRSPERVYKWSRLRHELSSDSPVVLHCAKLQCNKCLHNWLPALLSS